MSRKLLSLALILALLLTAMTIPAMAEEPTTVTWYGVGASSDHQARINEAASKYLQSQGINANLEIVKLGWGDYLKTYQTMMAAHEEFDLINADGSTLMQYGVNHGVVEITDEMLAEKLPGVTAVANEGLLNALRYKGSLYLVPAMHEWAQYYGWAYYNMDIAEALDLDMASVKTLDDCDAIFEKVHAAYPDVTVVWFDNMELSMLSDRIDTINHLVTSVLGIDTKVENADIFSFYENEDVIKMLRKVDEWGHKGYINTDPTIAAMSLINDGKLFANIGRFKPGSGPQYTNANARYGEMAWDPDAAPVLGLKDAPSGWGTAISSTTSDLDTTLAVLNMAYTDATLINLIVFGEENTDYTLTEDGFAEIIPGGYAAEEYASHTWQFGNEALNLVKKDFADLGLADIWDVQAAFNLAAVPVQCAGFFFNSEDVDIEMAAVNNVYEEYGFTLWHGQCDDLDATLNEFVKKLYANGLQALLDEANSQYDEFLASK